MLHFLSSKDYDALEVTYTVAANPLRSEQELVIASCEQGVVAVRPITGSLVDVLAPDWQRDDAKGKQIKQEVEAFLTGAMTAFSSRVVLSGSPFKEKVWHAIAGIPYGEVITYSELAEHAGNPKAIRAAASGCATNPVPLIVPCHRVVGKAGGLGGFAWGLPYKQALLSMEQKQVQQQKAA